MNNSKDDSYMNERFLRFVTLEINNEWEENIYELKQQFEKHRTGN